MMKELKDQSAHFLAAFLMVSIANLLGAEVGLAAGLYLGFSYALVREITEEGEVSWKALLRALGSWLDILFWSLGGFAAGVVKLLI